MTYALVPTSDAFPAYADQKGSQFRSDIAAPVDGGAIVVYPQKTQPDQTVYHYVHEMFAQRYEANGTAVGMTISIDLSDSDNDGKRPAAAKFTSFTNHVCSMTMDPVMCPVTWPNGCRTKE